METLIFVSTVQFFISFSVCALHCYWKASKSLVFCDFFQRTLPLSDDRHGDERYGSDWNGSASREGTLDRNAASPVICLQFTSLLKFLYRHENFCLALLSGEA